VYFYTHHVELGLNSKLIRFAKDDFTDWLVISWRQLMT